MGILWDLTRGAVAGTAGTWVMDLVTTGMYEQQPAEVTAREKAAQPGGRTSVENLLELLESTTGQKIADDMRPAALQALHYALGAVPGALYAVMRERIPGVSAARGMLLGLALFAVNDEWLNTRLGLAGPPDAYPIEAHARGLVGHLALGVTTEAVLGVLPG
jgi:hypothetical protein